MTLSEIATFVCGKLGQTDANSVALCKGFVKRRFQLAWDAHTWRDSLITEPATIATSNTTALPANVERVVAVRANGRFLDPIDANYLIQADPTIFERTGAPTVYEEYTDNATNVHGIRVFPTPTASTPLLIVGKRIRPELSDDTSPALRNIDNCLIAYAQGDMLQRQRHYAKAQELYQEAGALLDAAKAVEDDQSNRPRQAKALTVSGNSLAELADAVCARCGTYGLDNIILAKEFLRRNYQAVYDASLWQESTVVARVTSDGGEIVLPHFFGRVIAVRGANNFSLGVMDTSLIFSIAPSIFEQTGTPAAYTVVAPVAVKVLPPGREKLTLVSSDSTDKTPVFIRGESEGDEVTETIVLNGTTPVDTANLYDVPLTLAKQITAGDVTVTGHTSTVELLVLPAAERERKHIRLWVQPNATAASNVLVLGKRKITPLVADEDTPMLRDIQQVLIDLAVADLFSRLGKPTEAADARQSANTSLKTLMDLETRQGASEPRVVPTIEPMGYDYGCYEGFCK